MILGYYTQVCYSAELMHLLSIELHTDLLQIEQLGRASVHGPVYQ